MKIGVGVVVVAVAAGAAAGAMLSTLGGDPPVAAGLAVVEVDDVEGQEYEMDVPLELVPDVVLEAARGAVDGIVLTEASIELESDGLFFELEGSVGGREYEIEVTPDGDVIEVEDEEDEEDEDDEDD